METKILTRMDGQIEATSEVTASVEKIAKSAKNYVEQSRAKSTLKAYRSDWEDFVAWCDRHGFASLPASPATVAFYLVDLADRGRAVSTLERRISSISQMHKAAKHNSPTGDVEVRTVWAGIRRARGTAQRRVAPIVTDDLRIMIEALPDTLAGHRDRALLLVGFVGAFRRGDLVAIDVEDLTRTAEGIVIHVRRSKEDQEAAGQMRAVPYGSNPLTCPVRALQTWLDASGITAGPVFRRVNRHGQLGENRLTGQSVALIIKRAAEGAGLDADLYSGHSLRAGFATASARAGAHERDIARVTGHRSLHVLRRYIREGQLFTNPALRSVGL